MGFFILFVLTWPYWPHSVLSCDGCLFSLTDPGMAMDMELSITGPEPGRIDHTLYCHVMNLEDPLHLQVQAEFKVRIIQIHHRHCFFKWFEYLISNKKFAYAIIIYIYNYYLKICFINLNEHLLTVFKIPYNFLFFCFVTKGPEVSVDEPDVNFGLVRLGQTVTKEVTVNNLSQIITPWSVRDKPALLRTSIDGEEMEIEDMVGCFPFPWNTAFSHQTVC